MSIIYVYFGESRQVFIPGSPFFWQLNLTQILFLDIMKEKMTLYLCVLICSCVQERINIMLFLLKGKWALVPERSYFLNQVVWGLLFMVVVFVILVAIWSVIRKPLSRFMKVKEAYVEVLYVPENTFTRSAIAVRFLKPKKRRRKGFYIKNAKDIDVGAKGIMRYQGVNALEFQQDLQIVKTDYHQKFGFMVHKQRKAEQQKKERLNRKIRKYW